MVVTIENMTVADGAEVVQRWKEAIQREGGLGGKSALGWWGYIEVEGG